jgi:hypothetical protein
VQPLVLYAGLGHPRLQPRSLRACMMRYFQHPLPLQPFLALPHPPTNGRHAKLRCRRVSRSFAQCRNGCRRTALVRRQICHVWRNVRGRACAWCVRRRPTTWRAATGSRHWSARCGQEAAAAACLHSRRSLVGCHSTVPCACQHGPSARIQLESHPNTYWHQRLRVGCIVANMPLTDH